MWSDCAVRERVNRELSELGVPQVATTAEMPSGNYAQKMAHA